MAVAVTSRGKSGAESLLLAVNGGSSSLRCSLFRSEADGAAGEALVRMLGVHVERVGADDPVLTGRTAQGAGSATRPVSQEAPLKAAQAADHVRALQAALDWMAGHVALDAVAAVGLRIVHGGPRCLSTQEATPALREELERIAPFAPEHVPAQIALLDACTRRFPEAARVLCFDTAFHRDLPREAHILALPRRLLREGVRRYGFHGLSCAFLMHELQRVGSVQEAGGRVILAHLGHGASLTAVRNGASLDTSMGFTPAAGIPMSTRSGDLDPGLVNYLARTEGQTADRFDDMVNRRSGLLGVSETSGDMRALLALEPRDPRAADAVALFCYQARKTVGAFTAALGGLDTLVFAGGIGENAPTIRARICEGLQCLGLVLDEQRNAAGADILSRDDSRVRVRLIRTDEELQIAREVALLLARTSSKTHDHVVTCVHPKEAKRP